MVVVSSGDFVDSIETWGVFMKVLTFGCCCARAELMKIG